MDAHAPDSLLGFCKVRVLLIEDEAVDAALVQAHLRRSALDVELRLVGTEEGLRRALGEFEPDLVISDFTLSGFDGFAALEVTRQLSPSLPFIFLSDNVRVDHRLGEKVTDIVRKTDLNRPREPAAVVRAPGAAYPVGRVVPAADGARGVRSERAFGDQRRLRP